MPHYIVKCFLLETIQKVHIKAKVAPIIQFNFKLYHTLAQHETLLSIVFLERNERPEAKSDSS